MNVFFTRRRTWILAIIAGAVLISGAQSLLAQSEPKVEAKTPGASGQLKTLAVVAGARYEKLMADINYLGPLVGHPEAGQMAEAILTQFTQGKIATALDKTKPWGIIVQTDGSGFYPVVCLPVAKLDDVLELAKAHQMEVKDADDGAKEVSMPNGQSLFAKAGNEVVFIAKAENSLKHLPDNPLEILAKKVGDYDLTAYVSVKNVPEMWKQFAIGAMQAGMQQQMRKTDDETDEQYADRQKLMDSQIEQFKRMVNEIEAVKIGWAIDPNQKRTYLDYTYQFLPGSKMAQQVSAYTKLHSNFGGFYQPDSAVTGLISLKTDPQMIADQVAQIDGAMRNFREQINRKIDKQIGDPKIAAAGKSAAGDMFDALEATLKEGTIDGGVSAHLSKDSMTLVAGLHVKEPAKVESALKKLDEVAKSDPNYPGMKWKAANHNGVSYDTITAPVPAGEEGPRRVFGDNLDIVVGIGPDAVYFGLGRDAMNAVNKAIDASVASRSKEVAPLEASMSLTPIMQLTADEQKNEKEKEVATAMAEMLKNDAQGRDHVHLVSQVVPNGLQIRLEAEDGVLRLIGVATQQRQMRRARP